MINFYQAHIIKFRKKLTIGIHLTDQSFEAEPVAIWIREMVGGATEIGIRVRTIGMDMGSCNQAV